MRRLTGAILYLACAVCLTGATLTRDGPILILPALILAGMGCYQFSRGGDDDLKRDGLDLSGDAKRKPDEK